MDNRDYHDIDDNDYDEYPERGGLRKVLSASLMVAAIVGFGTIAYNMVFDKGSQEGVDNLPMIEANNQPFKETPENPGGLQFDHQDKSIYNELAAGETNKPVAEQITPGLEPSVEDIAAMKEEDLGKTAPAAGDVASATTAPQPTEQAPQPTVREHVNLEPIQPLESETVKEVPVVATAAKPAAPQQVKPTVIAVAKETPAPQPKVEKAPAVAPKAPAPVAKAEPAYIAPKPQQVASIQTQTTPVTSGSGRFMAQLGAFRSETDANQAWSKLRGKHSVLASYASDVQRAEIGGKGVVFRLRVGPFTSSNDARSVCSTLQGAGQPCFTIKQ